MDSSTDQARDNYRAFQVTMVIIPTIAVFLRFVARYVNAVDKSTMFWWDDWTVLMALPFCIVTNVGGILMTNWGFGKHLTEIPLEQLSRIFKILWATEFTFNISSGLAKASALFLIERLFTTKHASKLKWAIWATQILNALWTVGSCLGIVFSCDPVRKGWDPIVPGTCHSPQEWMGSTIPSVIIDVIILLLPMRPIWKLHMDAGRKATLICTFTLGYAIAIISGGRLIALIKNEDALMKDVTYAALPVFYWYGIEVPVTILSACLVILASLGRRLWRTKALPYINEHSTGSSISRFKLFSSKASKSGGSYAKKSGSDHSAKGHVYAGNDVDSWPRDASQDLDLEKGEENKSASLADITGEGKWQHQQGLAPMRMIRVRDDFRVDSARRQS